MAEQTVSDLVVKMRPEGTEETTDALEDAGDQFEESAEQSEDSAETINENAQIWDNAMNVLVTGLAVASGGLLSQVPVIGEVFEGLFSIIDALSFQMDNVLRPSLTALSNVLFGISESIFEAEGAWGTFIGIIASAVTLAIGMQAAFMALSAILPSLSGLAYAAGVAFGALQVALGIVAAALGITVGAAAAVVAAIIGLIAIIAILVTDYKGMRTALIDTMEALWSDLTQWWNDLKADTVAIVSALVDDVVQWWSNLKADTRTIVSELVSDLRQYGRDLINAFIEGIQAVASNIGTVIQTEVTERVEGSVVGQLLGTAQSAVGLDTSDQMRGSSSSDSNVYIDGRRVDQQQGRYRKDGVLGRGRQ